MPPKNTTQARQIDNKTVELNGNTLSIKNAVTSVVGGEIFYLDSSGVNQQLNPGTAGQVLQTQGDGSAPQWANASSFTLVGSKTISNDDNFTISISNSSNYSAFMVVYRATGDATSGNFRINFNADTGANYDYDRTEDGTIDSVTGATYIELANALNSDTQWGQFVVTNEASFNKHISGTHGKPGIIGTVSGTWNETSNNINSMLFEHAGNFVDGFVQVYGLS